MKSKIIITSVVLVSMIITGCSYKSMKSKSMVADDITKQRTITKVQNDVSEIMYKDYEYVLKNMGMPYYITYYIDSKNIKNMNIEKIEDLEKNSNVVLVYPKDENNNEIDKSALYVELYNNKVINVQTYKLSESDIETEAVYENKDLIINKYSPDSNLSLEEIKKETLSNYMDKNEDEISNLVGNNQPNFDISIKDRTKGIKVYLLKDKHNNLKDGLVIYLENNIIKSINILNNMDIIKFINNNLIEQ